MMADAPPDSDVDARAARRRVELRAAIIWAVSMLVIFLGAVVAAWVMARRIRASTF